jgi:hypothetical protein
MAAVLQRTDFPVFTSNRNSSVSTTASFHTARTATPLDSLHSLASSRSSASSSTHTLGPERNTRHSEVSTVHVHTREVHIVKVPNDTVQLEAGPHSQRELRSLTFEEPQHLRDASAPQAHGGPSQEPPKEKKRSSSLKVRRHASLDTSLPSELANDIQQHAEQIRRERMRQRAKAQEVEATLTQPAREVPLVGNLIGEDHVNYVLMYNMLTGIRIGVRLPFRSHRKSILSIFCAVLAMSGQDKTSIDRRRFYGTSQILF